MDKNRPMEGGKGPFFFIEEKSFDELMENLINVEYWRRGFIFIPWPAAKILVLWKCVDG